MYSTSRIILRKGGKHRALYAVLEGNMAAGRLVYNQTLFHIRNLYTGLKKDEKSRTENENKVIADVTAAISDINAGRLSRGRPPAEYPSPERPWLPEYLWMGVMGRILKDFYSRPSCFYSKLEQNAVRSACRAVRSFTASLKDRARLPEKYRGRPKLPGYLKKDRAFTLVYDCQMVKLQTGRTRNSIRLAGLDPVLQTGKKEFCDIVQVSFSMKHGEIVACICEKKTDGTRPCHKPDPGRMIGIDPGVSNFLAVCPGFGATPFIIPGGAIKAANQYYNKRKAALQEDLVKKEDRYTSRRLERLGASRDHFIMNYFHQTARYIVNYAVSEMAGTIVIGQNVGWKQDADMGKANNQKFTQIPHAAFFRILADKAQREGIRVVFTEESYTSRASALDRDPVPVWKEHQVIPEDFFSGRRIRRGMYVSCKGIILNADINGAANIIRKYDEKGLQEDLSYLSGSVRVVHVA